MILWDKANRLFLFAAVCGLVLTQCVGKLAGNSTQIGNGMVAGVIYERDGKTPAKGAQVSVRKKVAPSSFPAGMMKRFADTAAATTTDGRGVFMIDSIDTGLYILQATDGANDFVMNDSVTVADPDSTVFLSDTLKPAGVIKGVVALREGGDPRKVLVRVYPVAREAKVGTDGSFRFPDMAEGTYDLRVLSTLDEYGVIDTPGIRVKSSDTADLDTIELPFLDIPTLKNVAISYDTLKQRVTIHWNKPEAEVVKSVNVYRRAVDPVTAIFTPINFHPILDTFFVDSLCDPNRTYEYRACAVDSNGDEGARSAGVKAHISLYDIIPADFKVTYDTLRQRVTLHWRNPDDGRVGSYNVYRRNIDRSEAFWTPFNDVPITDTVFVDSTFNICPNYDSASITAKEPTYEYCVGALIGNIREGTRTKGAAIRVSYTYLLPGDVGFSRDSLTRAVTLRWCRPDTTLVKSFNVYRENTDRAAQTLEQLNMKPLKDTVFTDTVPAQNQTYRYYIASLVAGNRGEVKSEAVEVLVGAPPGEDER